MKFSTLLAGAALLTGQAYAHDMIPGKPQSQPIALVNGTLHTVSQGVLPDTDILFVSGKIEQMGKDLSLPSNTQVIDISGQHVYPGMISLASQLGLSEIEAVRATEDGHEVGKDNANLKAHIAFNADSEIIPTVRSNGVTHTQVVPGGDLIMGQSSMMKLDGWNWEDSLELAEDGVHIRWPRVGLNKSPWESRTAEEQNKANKKQIDALNLLLEQAKRYWVAKKQGAKVATDVRWEAMLKVFDGEKTLYAHANDKRQMQSAIDVAKKHGFKLTIVGARDAWRMLDVLAKEQVGIIYTAPFGLPSRYDEAYDQAFSVPKRLQDAGITYAIGLGESWGDRNLGFAAGMAVNYGLTKAQALEAVTLSAAKLTGLQRSLGSLEVGKQASLVVSQGDLLDYLTQKINYMYIDGRRVDLNNRHKQLFDKYQQK